MYECANKAENNCNNNTNSATSNNSKRPSNIERVGRYRLTKTIGRGNFAVVKLGKHDVTRTKVAVKIINKSRIDDENMRKIYREIKILKSLKHRHIVELYQIMESETKLFLIMEYASGGEVLDYVRKKNRMNEREARRVFRQVISSVAYCHASGVVHRDLKLDHMLLSASNTIKLVDFGFSNFATEHTLLQTWCGSPQYAAPELFQGEQYDGQKADIWSLGVILYALVCGGWPFPSSMEQIRNAVLEGHISFPFYVSLECADLIRKMLTVKPQYRLNIRQVMQHRWFCADDWNDEWDTLMRVSMNPDSSYNKDETTLNYTCIAFMQQRGYSGDKIIESIMKKRFDDEYATYQLLCAKLRSDGGLSALNACGSAALALNPHLVANGVRRGSRGSITTGRVDYEPPTEMPLISTIDLAKLGLSSSEEESSSSDSDNSATSPVANMQNYLSQRRHTALGVPSALGISGGCGTAGAASASGNVGFVPPVPYPLIHNLAEMSNLANPLVTLLKPPLMLLPKFYPVTNGAGHMNFAQQPMLFSTTTNGVHQPNNEPMGVEEAGALYLKSKRSGKRHTVHGMNAANNYAPADCMAAPFPLRQHPAAQQHDGGGYCATSTGVHQQQMPPGSNGRFRNEPYLPPPTSAARHRSDFCHLTPDDMLRLNQLYQNAIQRPESPVENMRNLQHEFHQLKSATTADANFQNNQISPSNSTSSDIRRASPRGSPPGQVLDMILEQDATANNNSNNEPNGGHHRHHSFNTTKSCSIQRQLFTSSLRNPSSQFGPTPTIEVTNDDQLAMMGASFPSTTNGDDSKMSNCRCSSAINSDVEMKLT